MTTKADLLEWIKHLKRIVIDVMKTKKPSNKHNQIKMHPKE